MPRRWISYEERRHEIIRDLTLASMDLLVPNDDEDVDAPYCAECGAPAASTTAPQNAELPAPGLTSSRTS